MLRKWPVVEVEYSLERWVAKTGNIKVGFISLFGF